MKINIALKPFSGSFFLKNKIFSINNGSNIFYGLKKELKKLNIEINTIDINSKNESDTYIFCDVPYPWEFFAWKVLITNRSKNILICFESPLVNPFSHMIILYVFFDRIYTWNDKLVDEKKVIKLNLPQLSGDIEMKSVAFKKRKFIVLINSNKMSLWALKLLSPFKKDLYKERVKAIEFFENNFPRRFSLYGKGWNESRKLSIKDKVFGFKKYSTYRGQVKNKIKLLSGFKYSLCFENCVAEGYITEKIFDCFKARCVPIYLGAPNIEKYIDKRCFIDFRDFTSYENMISFLDGISERRYQKYIDAINELLSSKKFQDKWLEAKFKNTLIECINDI